jgi:hypothetical protein
LVFYKMGMLFFTRCVLVIFTSIKGPLSIFPNPTKNELNIDLKGVINSDFNSNFNVKITDLMGRIVYQNQYDKSLINNTLQMNIGDVISGLYVVSIHSDKAQFSRLILKN